MWDTCSYCTCVQRYLIEYSGDSYSSTEYNVTQAYPGPSNPLGNPAFPGITLSDGPNWVDMIEGLGTDKRWVGLCHDTINRWFSPTTLRSAVP
jgi:hypothetical protein